MPSRSSTQEPDLRPADRQGLDRERRRDRGQRLESPSPVPLYRQLFADLRRRIRAGDFDRAGVLPSEARIEKDYAVSRITVRRALLELDQEGLIERRQGRATRIRPHRLHRPAEAGLDAELANMLSFGFKTDSEVLEAREVKAPADVAERLGLAPGTPVHRSRRLRRVSGLPLCHSLAYLPLDLAGSVSRADLEREPLLLLLVRNGLVIGRVDQSIGAVAAEPEMARLLGTAAGEPLLLIERLFRDNRERPVEQVVLHFRADRYRYGMTFRADADENSRVESTDCFA